MGGDAFGNPAVRLPPDLFTALRTDVATRLKSLGVGVALPPALPKSSHGDVDILVASELAPLKGRSRGSPSVTFPTPAGSPGKGNAGGEAQSEPGKVDKRWREVLRVLEEGRVVDGVCSLLCGIVGGERWSRNGDVVSIAVPAASHPHPHAHPHPHSHPHPHPHPQLLPRQPDSATAQDTPTPQSANGHDGEAFYQIDLILVPPPSLNWAQMALTYGHTRGLLKLLLRTLLPVRVHDTFLGLILRCEVELTRDVGRFCAWLGVDDYDPRNFESGSTGSQSTGAESAGTAASSGERGGASAAHGDADTGSVGSADRAGHSADNGSPYTSPSNASSAGTLSSGANSHGTFSTSGTTPHGATSNGATFPGISPTATHNAHIRAMSPLFAWLASAPPSSLGWKAYSRLLEQYESGTLPRQSRGMGGIGGSKRQQRLRVEDEVNAAFCQYLRDEPRRFGSHCQIHSGSPGEEQSCEQTRNGRRRREERGDVVDPHDVARWRSCCPELSELEIDALVYFGEMDTYLSLRL